MLTKTMMMFIYTTELTLLPVPVTTLLPRQEMLKKKTPTGIQTALALPYALHLKK